MSDIRVVGSSIGSALQELLTGNDDIVPGSQPSYQLCKAIYSLHPLGAKLAEKPIAMAQSQQREINIPNSPEDRIKEAFEAEWVKVGADLHIFNTARLSRVYGIASIACMVEDQKTEEPIDFDKLWRENISFNVFDPLNTAGSLVLSQNPMSMDFQHTTDIRVSGQTFHRSRSCVIMNESPVYIEYTSSAYGFVGRSVYQRALFPLKSFLQTMITDDLVAVKAGVLVAKMKQAGSIIDNAMQKMFGVKRNIVKEAQNGNVISIGADEAIESLNLQNLEGPLKSARHNILENIAAAAGMPAKLVTQETLADGFGEGTEDAKEIARYVDRVRESLQPLYDYFTKIVMYRAWNPEFYKTIQKDFPDYAAKKYNVAFYEWKNGFVAKWPSLLTEPDSEKVAVEEVKLRSALAYAQVLIPMADQQNKAEIIKWIVDNLNAQKFLFDSPLELDYDALAAFEPMPAGGEGEPDAEDDAPPPPKPWAAMDSADELRAAVDRLVSKPARKMVVVK